MNTIILKEIIYNLVGNQTGGNFEVTAPPRIMSLLRESLIEEAVTSGLMIVATPEVVDKPFDCLVWGGFTVKFIVGDEFSVRMVPDKKLRGVFTLCESKQWTLEKFILYVKDIHDLQPNDVITYGVNGPQFVVQNFVPLLNDRATHHVNCLRIDQITNKSELKMSPGTIFTHVSRASGEY